MNKLQVKKTFLGIDYGTKRIGLAVGDDVGGMAQAFKTIYKLSELKDIVPAKQIDAFVMGLPLQPDGTEGDTCVKARAFAAKLKSEFNLPVYWVDERLTSQRAEIFLRDTLCMRPDKRKKILDAESARIILQTFLNERKKNG